MSAKTTRVRRPSPSVPARPTREPSREPAPEACPVTDLDGAPAGAGGLELCLEALLDQHPAQAAADPGGEGDRKSTRLNSSHYS